MTVTVEAPTQLLNAHRNQLREQIDGAIAAGHDVEVDLASTGYVDTAAIGMLLRCTRQARDAGRRLTLRGVNQEHRSYFGAIGLLGGALELT